MKYGSIRPPILVFTDKRNLPFFLTRHSEHHSSQTISAAADLASRSRRRLCGVPGWRLGYTDRKMEPSRPTSLCALLELKKSSRWLNAFAGDVYSQTGEDGILERALSIFPTRTRWCVEFGAWDGKYLSNTFRLVERENYNVVLIEGDGKKYRALCSEYPFRDRAIFENRLVGWSKDDGLDRILEKHPVPLDFDLLSIDVDGNDYHIWKATEKFRPKLVLIEFNPTASNHIDFVQPPDPNCNEGNSPAAIVRLGKEKDMS